MRCLFSYKILPLKMYWTKNQLHWSSMHPTGICSVYLIITTTIIIIINKRKIDSLDPSRLILLWEHNLFWKPSQTILSVPSASCAIIDYGTAGWWHKQWLWHLKDICDHCKVPVQWFYRSFTCSVPSPCVCNISDFNCLVLSSWCGELSAGSQWLSWSLHTALRCWHIYSTWVPSGSVGHSVKLQLKTKQGLVIITHCHFSLTLF